MAKRRKKKNASGRTTAAAEAGDTLPPAELDVLSCVWREGPVTAGRIREMMLKHRPMAHGSVVTLLSRLEAKELVTKDKGPVGKAFLFKPLKKPQNVQRKLVKDMVDQVFAGDTGAMACLLLEVNPPTADNVSAIQAALNSGKRKSKRSRRG